MPTLGVNVAIIRAGRILLTKREDFEVWCLPGGEVDPGESLAQAALREAREETGLEVRLTRLVGTYSEPHWRAGGMHIVLFSAEPLGDTMQLQPSEVVEAGYFAADDPPEPLLWWHRQRIRDVLDGVGGGVAWTQDVTWPLEEDVPRSALYELRDRSGLSRQEYFLRYFGQSRREWLEVGGSQGQEEAKW